MLPKLQNLLLKSSGSQQVELNSMVPEQRAAIEEGLAEYYRFRLPGFDAFIWIFLNWLTRP